MTMTIVTTIPKIDITSEAIPSLLARLGSTTVCLVATTVCTYTDQPVNQNVQIQISRKTATDLKRQ